MGSIQADSEQGTVSQWQEPKSFGKEALNLCLGEYFRPSMTVNFHPPTGNTSHQ
jgi:hypothetical protein